jgi:hypothetical protein
MLTVVCRPGGQVSGLPMDVLFQSWLRISSPILPPPFKKAYGFTVFVIMCLLYDQEDVFKNTNFDYWRRSRQPANPGTMQYSFSLLQKEKGRKKQLKNFRVSS